MRILAGVRACGGGGGGGNIVAMPTIRFESGFAQNPPTHRSLLPEQSLSAVHWVRSW
jgi:hypothetical protein